MKTRTILTAFIWVLCFKAYTQHIQKDNVVGTSITIQSQVLTDQREIQIFLPDGYADSVIKYPVLYILDGQRYFLHGVSLQKSFVEFKQTPEFIVVGISKNLSDRNRNYSSNAQQYLEFIKEEVVKYVNSEFRTSNKKLLFGWAYAGGFTIETMLNQPNLFDSYIAASPFPLKEKISKVDSLLLDNLNIECILYFTSGTNEGVVKEGTEELNRILTKKAPETLNWTFKELEGEEHRSTPFTTLYHGLKNYFKYYPEIQFNTLEEFAKAGGLPNVKEYYKKRAEQFGFSTELSDWTMFSLTRNAIRANDYAEFKNLANEFEGTDFIIRLRLNRACSIADFYLENKANEKALSIFTLLAEIHPDEEAALQGLGDTYKALKKDRKAAKYYKKAKALSKNTSN